MWSLSQRPAGCNNVADRLRSRYVGGKLLELSAPGRAPSLGLLGEAGLGAFDAGGAPPAGAGEAVSGREASPESRHTREGFQRFQSLMDKAGSALKAGDNERAFDLATAAILAFPENPSALFIRGVAGINLNRLDAVMTDATWGMRLDPANKAKWPMRRAARARRGDPGR